MRFLMAWIFGKNLLKKEYAWEDTLKTAKMLGFIGL